MYEVVRQIGMEVKRARAARHQLPYHGHVKIFDQIMQCSWSPRLATLGSEWSSDKSVDSGDDFYEPSCTNRMVFNACRYERRRSP